MRINRIGYQTNPNFAGEKTDKAKKAIRNTAGAAAVALAASLNVDKADAQVFYPLPMPVPPTYYYYNPTISTVNIPNCFIYGDVTNFDYNKSLSDNFNEIDANGNENGVLSAQEVARTERENWNATHLYPYNSNQYRYTVHTFNTLSRMYNEEDSNPKTINYSEYRKIMNDYMQARNVTSFFNLLRIFTVPNLLYPRPIAPPPPHHHHPAPPPHRHR